MRCQVIVTVFNLDEKSFVFDFQASKDLILSKMFGKLIASILPRVKADDEELVDPQTVLRVSFCAMFSVLHYGDSGWLCRGS